MKVPGPRIRNSPMALWSIVIRICIRVIGFRERGWATALIITPMAICIVDSGGMIPRMDMASSKWPRGTVMKALG